MDIQTIIAIASVVLAAVQTVVVILATIFAISQLRENTRSRQLDAIGRVLDYVSTEDIRLARKKFDKMQIPSDSSELDDEQRETIGTVLRAWARLALLMNLNLLTDNEKDALLRSFSWTIISNWQKVRPYIEYKRQESNRQERWADVEELVQQAIVWRTTHNMKLVSDKMSSDQGEPEMSR